MERPEPPQIALILRDIANLFEIVAKDRHRAGAYRRGADAVEQLNADLDKLIAEGRLTETPGIGNSLATQIAEIRQTGHASALTRLAADLPDGAMELLRVPGVSLRGAKTLVEQLGVRSEVELREACEAGRVRGLPGFGEAKERKLFEALTAKSGASGGVLLSEAMATARAVELHLCASPDVREANAVGATRRGLELVGDVEVLAIADRPDAAFEQLSSMPGLGAEIERGPGKLRVRLASGVTLALHVAPPAAGASARLRLTGSDAHLTELDAIAARAGLQLSVEGLRTSDGVRVDVADEAAIYARLGLAWVPPPLREGLGELAQAARGEIPRLLERGDLRGFVHCHTDHSDGRHTIEQMARAAEAFGMEYITITDHSPSANYARGLELGRLERQWDEIAAVQEKVKIRILRGTESDILKDGALDHPDRVLEQLDVVIASVHSRFSLGPAETTARIVRAMKHPLFKIWGHALGRLLLKRPPVACDLDAILEAIAGSRAAIELNGDPHRMDLAPDLARRAKALGIPFVVSVDAHATGELRNIDYGVLMAQRAGLGPANVLNTRDAVSFLRAVRPAPAA